MRQLAILGLFALFLVLGAPARAQNTPTEVGEVSFVNSGSPAAQEPFLRGFALLHNFEYDDAAEQFRKAQEIDPDFAMAFWGEAMTYNHPIWMQQDLDAARGVLGRLGATPEARQAKAKTERERDYLRTVEILYGSGEKKERDFHYADAMAALHQRYPDDVDATAFYALSLLGTAHAGRDFAIYMRSAALLEEVFPTHTRHPGVLHYLIHSYDDPVHAPLGMRAARLYGGVAPKAGHALHMTSHIFVALGQWDDVIAANDQAMRVVNQHRAAQGKPRQTCGHYVSWLHYAYLQERRLDEAKQQLDACREMAMKEIAAPRPAKDAHASHAAHTGGEYAEHAGDYAEMRVFHAIETGRWDAADPFVLPEGADLNGARFTLAYGEALMAAGGDPQALRAAAARLREQNKDTEDARNPAAARQSAEIRVRQIEALERIRGGKKDEGLALLRQAAEAESVMALEFGPPVVEKPTWELLGDELLALGRNAEAEPAYQSALARAPGRTRSLEGLLRTQQALGKTEAAERTRAQLRQYVKTETAAR
jgi:tetratricopeptide (TPR) repeat protein